MPDSKRNLIALGAMALVVVAWMAFKQVGQESPAEAEANVHQQMSSTGRSPDELCAHAKIVEDAFAREGKIEQAKRWAFTREMQCISADACRRIEGGCPPSSVAP